jgi:hypothetical protein
LLKIAVGSTHGYQYFAPLGLYLQMNSKSEAIAKSNPGKINLMKNLLLRSLRAFFFGVFFSVAICVYFFVNLCMNLNDHQYSSELKNLKPQRGEILVARGEAPGLIMDLIPCHARLTR